MIYGPDGHPIERDLLGTYADEATPQGRSRLDSKPQILAQLDEDIDIRWLAEIRRVIGVAELKWLGWERWWWQIDERLRQAISRNVACADVFIATSESALIEVRQFVQRDLQVDTTHPAISALVYEWALEFFLRKGAQQRLWAIAELARIPSLGEPRLAPESPTWNPSALLHRLRGKKQNVELYVVRSHAAFADILEPGQWFRDHPPDMCLIRYYCPHHHYAEHLACSLMPPRTFDDGNSLVVEELVKLRQDLDSELDTLYPTAAWPASGPIRSASSQSIEPLQVADVAVGYASWLWRQHGLEAIVRHFRTVYLNGIRL